MKNYLIILIFMLSACSLGDSIDGASTLTEETMNPIAIFETSMGTFKVELYLDQMPVTAGNMKTLIEQGYYDGQRFHRVIDSFMIQGGDPQSKNESSRDIWGTGGPGYTIEDEFVEGLSNVRGTLSMANSGPNSGGSQFFINLVDNTYLDWDKPPTQSKHPVFGKIVEGMDIIDSIGNVDTNMRDQPSTDIVITSVTIE